jgi:hypothetical protein
VKDAEGTVRKNKSDEPSIRNKSNNNRRAFLKAGGIMTAAALGSAALPDVASALPVPSSGLPTNPATSASMPTRNLGKTGYKVGIFSLGGQAALEKSNNEATAVPIIEKALDLGVNYIDTSSIYGGPDRWSEQYVGKVMKHRRSQAFLATKTKERTRDGSMRMIETSLKLLQTDHVDLWQLHDIGTMTDINEIFSKGGAMEALLEAREQKIVRYLGITGHYRPDALMEAIHRHPFDTILMAVNAADPHHYSFSEQLLPLAVDGAGADFGNAGDAAGYVLFALAAREHGHHWLRFNCPAGTKRPTGARVHSTESAADDGADPEGPTGGQAIVIFSLLRAGLIRSMADPAVFRASSHPRCCS